MAPDRVVIVGGGLAGLRTAERLRRHGHTGPITLVSGEPAHPYERPPLSKGLLVQEQQPAPVLLRPVAKYAELDLDLRLGVHATGLDDHARTVALRDGGEVSYDRLVIATGARARTVAQWSRFDNVHTLRTWHDLTLLRATLRSARHVTVVGAGVLGGEIAASARTLGADVTLLDQLASPMQRVLGSQLGHVAADLHRQHGVHLRMGTSVAHLEGNGSVEAVITADGDRQPTDAVVVAIGSVPETGWLHGSAVDIDDGVICDATGRSSVPDVYAVGDVARMPHPGGHGTRRLEHWTSAADTATLVAANLVAGPDQQQPLTELPYFWSDQHGVKIQALGIPDAADEVVVATGDLTEHRFLALYVHKARVRAVVAMNMPAALARCRPAVMNATLASELLAQAPWQRKKVTT